MLQSLLFTHQVITGGDANALLPVIAAFVQASRATHPGATPIVVYDYLKIATGSGNTKNPWAVLGDLADVLKERVAKQLGVPVLAGVQLNREAEGLTQIGVLEDGLAKIAGSDTIARLADVVLLLRRLVDDEQTHVLRRFPARNDSQVRHDRLRFGMAIHLLKNRHGALYPGGIPLYFDAPACQYEELAYVRDGEGQVIRNARGYAETTPELELLHSRDFRLAPKANAAEVKTPTGLKVAV